MIKLICTLALLACAQLAAAAEKPNILFIALDDLRPELHCYGQTHVHSPNIDQLAQSGILFDRAYCQYPVCNASRSSLMTGLRPDSTGVYNNSEHFRKRAPNVVTLPQHFKDHGYTTRCFGKLYHGAFEKAYVGREFDDPPSWSLRPWYGSPQYYFTKRGIEIARDVYGKKYHKSGAELDSWTTEFVQGLATEAPDVPDSTLYDGEATDRAIRALSELKGQPFFLAVGYLKPHLPFVAPKKYWDLYDRSSLPLPNPDIAPPNAPVVALPRNVEVRVQYSDMRNQTFSETQTRELRHGYYACVSYVDALIGRLIHELDRLGLRDNTIIVLWGDHGYHLGEQDCWGKLTDFELAARVPLIVSAPSAKAHDSKSKALVELVDIYPSLCDLAHLPLPSHLEGTSFAPLLDSPDQPWKSAAFTQVVHGDAMGRSLRTDRYRFTQWQQSKSPTDTVALELYDYRKDPIEMDNIATRPEHAALIKQLTAKLQAGWQAAGPSAEH